MFTSLTRPQRTGGVDLSLLTSGHDVADARLHREVAAALSRGLRVEVLALGQIQDAPGGARTRTWKRPRGFARRLLHALTLPWHANGRVLLVLDPDLVVPALLKARLTGRRLVVDVHEDYAKLLRDRPWAAHLLGRIAQAGVGLAVRATGWADLVVVADEHVPPISVTPGRDGRERRLVVPNLPTAEHLPVSVDAATQPRVVYVGDVRASRGVHTMLQALEGSPGWQLDITGPVAPADQIRIAAWQATSPAADRVRWHGRRPPREAWQPVADAWAGLCLLDDTPAFREALPSKLYEYLCAGLPVIVTPRPRMIDLVERSGAGVVVADAAEAAAVLRRWMLDPGEAIHLRLQARRFAETLGDGTQRYADLAGRVAALSGACR